jgi:hypothetical protein
MIFELRKTGKLLHTGSETDCYYKLQRIQSASASWAMKYERYTIEPKAKQPKYETEYVTQGNFGQGWEDVTTEDNKPGGYSRLKEYKANDRAHPYRMVTRRALNAAYVPTV